MPVKVEVKGSIEEFQKRTDWKDKEGKPIQFPIKYTTEADSYTSKDDAVAAGKWPDSADAYVLASVNKASITAAKAAKYQELVADLKKQYEESSEFKRKELYESALRVFGDTEKGRKKAADYADAAMAQADSE